MAPEERATSAQEDVALEILDLRQRQLLKLIYAVPSAGVLWLYYLAATSTQPRDNLGIDGVPLLLVLLVASAGSHVLRRVHHVAASWLLLLGMIAGGNLIIASYPDSLALSFAIMPIMAASALLGTRQALLATILTGLASTVAIHVGRGTTSATSVLIQALLLYGLAFAMTWLGHSSLETAVDWALKAWEDAHRALLQTRERRAEIYRVARALDEASHRIERMNTELIAARRDAELARAQKARFAATVSHELRGPLHLILGFSRLMATSPESYGERLPSAYHADVEAIYRNTMHLAALVDDILDLSQVEADRLPLVKDRLDLEADVVEPVVDTVRPLAERKNLALQTALAGNLPWILADPVRLRQVLLNLLTNAIRLTDRGGITVRTACDGDSVLLSVQDTGIGIAPEDMPKLFQEFRKAKQARDVVPTGTGLGLYISRQLIDLHGGDIWAESQLGVGSTFHVKLPLPGTEKLPASVAARQVPYRRAGYEFCLILHDDANVLRLVSRYLEGYRVVGVTDEQDAILLMEDLHPRAIVTTPGRGEHIALTLAQAGLDVPIIKCDMPHLAEQRLGPVLSYLMKPISPQSLAAVLRHIGGTETTVLLVDDEPDAVRLLEGMLRNIPRQFKVLRAYDGAQALEIMRRTVPDVAFVDLVMPGLDGGSTIKRMRADARLRGVPVVVVSGLDVAEEGVYIGLPLTVCGQRPLAMGTWARCLKALLDAVSPRYLADVGPG